MIRLDHLSLSLYDLCEDNESETCDASVFNECP